MQITPTFAGGGSVLQRMGHGTIKLFDAINRDYLYEFFALDIVALWLTRIVTGLIVGRITVNALNEPNPAAKADTPFQLWRQDVVANIQGLNWGNAGEIFRREALTGPGLVFIPSLAYGIARRLTRNHTQEMNFGWLQRLHFAFQAGAQSMSSVSDAKPAQTLVKNTVQQFFSPMAQDDALAKLRNLSLADNTMLRQMPRSHISLQVPDTRTLGDVLRPYRTSGSSTFKTMGEFLDAWTHQYATQVDTLVSQHGGDRVKARKALGDLAQTMGDDLEAVWRGVTRHNGNALTHVTHEGLMPLRELRAVTPLFKPQKQLVLSATIKETSISTFTKNLGQFSDYWLDVLPKSSSKVAVPELLQKASQYVGRLSRIKGLTTLVGLVLAGSWLYFLPRFTQNGKSYPAARLFQQVAPTATSLNPNVQQPMQNPLQQLSNGPSQHRMPMAPLFSQRGRV